MRGAAQPQPAAPRPRQGRQGIPEDPYTSGWCPLPSRKSGGGPDLSRIRIDRRGVAPTGARRRFGLSTFLLLAVVGGGAWAYLTGRLSVNPDGGSAPLVETSLVASPGAAVPAPGEVTGNGYVIARRRAALSTVLSGRLIEVNVEEGNTVRRTRSSPHPARRLRREPRVGGAGPRRDEGPPRRALSSLAASRLDLDRLVSENAVLSDLVAQARAEADRTAQDVARNEPLQGRVIDKAAWDRYVSAAATAKASLQAAEGRVRAGLAAETAWKGEIARREAALATADAEIAKVEKAVEAAQILLDKTYVRAPFDGLVVHKDAEVGEVVAATGAGGNSRGSVVTIVDPATLEVQVELAETRLGAIQAGDRTRVFLDADPTKAIPGSVRQVWPTADRQKATVEMRIVLDERPAILRPEMGARVTFLAKGAAAAPAAGPARPRVARAAVTQRDGKDVVFVLVDGAVRLAPVALGAETAGMVEVLSGLAGGERVVMAPTAALGDGSKVKAKESMSPGPKAPLVRGWSEYRKGRRGPRRPARPRPRHREGQFTALMGPSGSGKTTLLNLIGGLDTAEGELIVGATRRFRAPTSPVARGQRGRVPGLQPDSGADGARERRAAAQADAALALAAPPAGGNCAEARGLGRSARPPAAAALGWPGAARRDRARDRVRPAAVLATADGRPRPQSAEQVLDLLGRLNREFKKTILMVTHDPHAAERAQSIVHLDKGQLGRIEHNQPAAAH
jgi:RND family efflux transporter MFP subunit